MFRRSVLIIAFLFCAPLAWAAFVDQSVTWENVGTRFLIALPVAALLVGLVRLAARPDPARKSSGDTASRH